MERVAFEAAVQNQDDEIGLLQIPTHVRRPVADELLRALDADGTKDGWVRFVLIPGQRPNQRRLPRLGHPHHTDPQFLLRLDFPPLPANHLQDLLHVVPLAGEGVHDGFETVLDVVREEECQLVQEFEDRFGSPAPDASKNVVRAEIGSGSTQCR